MNLNVFTDLVIICITPITGYVIVLALFVINDIVSDAYLCLSFCFFL